MWALLELPPIIDEVTEAERAGHVSDRTGSKWQSWGLNSQSLASDHSASQPLSQPRQSPEPDPARNWTKSPVLFSHWLISTILWDVGFSDSCLTNGNTESDTEPSHEARRARQVGQASFTSLSRPTPTVIPAACPFAHFPLESSAANLC